MGDYNIDLLQYEHSSLDNDFITMIISKSFLPYILQPTRVTDHSATVIDNIFSNVAECQTVSGMITLFNFLSPRKDIFHTNLVITILVTIQMLGKKIYCDYSLTDCTSLSDPQISVDGHFDYLYEPISECIDTHVPKKKVTKNTSNLDQSLG